MLKSDVMSFSVFEQALRLSTSLANRWYHHVMGAMEMFDITTPPRQAMFLAQIAHESGGLKLLVESFDYSISGLVIFGSRLTEADRLRLGRKSEEACVPLERQKEIANRVYAGRFGNGVSTSGDGWRFRGRGLKQITFSDNYRTCGQALGLNLLAYPELLEQDEHAAKSAGWFWSDRGLNAFADRGDFDTVTRAINGSSMNGYADRVSRWQLCKQHLHT